MESTSELLMGPAPGKVMESAAIPIKSILLAVHDDDELGARLQMALSVARACSAHLHLLHVIPIEAFTIADTYGGTFTSGEIVQVLEEQAARLRAGLEKQLDNEDVSWSYEIATSPILPELLKSSAFSDLLFIGRQPRWHEFSRAGQGFLGELVSKARTPLCIPGDGVRALDPFGNAVIAWNGSIQAANAVRANIGLLRMASTVRVARYTEDKDDSFPDVRLLEYLSRHGIAAVLDSRTPRSDFASDLVEYALVFAAEYLVMGGYGHSRAGEFLFGGVTRELLRACPVSLVMAH